MFADSPLGLTDDIELVEKAQRLAEANGRQWRDLHFHDATRTCARRETVSGTPNAQPAWIFVAAEPGSGEAAGRVQAWVALNREALQAFWSEGNAWLDGNNLGVSRSDIARNNATVPFRTLGCLALVLCVPVARFMHGH